MKPADNCQSFQNARSLGQDAIDTVYSWVADGSPAGNPADAPPNMTPNVVTLDWVDATVSPAASYTPAANLTTDYHCFVLDPKLAASRDVIGYEVTPGPNRMCTMLLYPADAATASAQDAKTPEVGWPCYGDQEFRPHQPSVATGPRKPPTKYPTNTGITLAAGQVLVMQIHYDNHHGGAWSPDQTSVKIQFAKTPVAKKATVLSVRNASFSIPSGATDYAVVGTMTTPSDGLIYGPGPACAPTLANDCAWKPLTLALSTYQAGTSTGSSSISTMEARVCRFPKAPRSSLRASTITTPQVQSAGVNRRRTRCA